MMVESDMSFSETLRRQPMNKKCANYGSSWCADFECPECPIKDFKKQASLDLPTGIFAETYENPHRYYVTPPCKPFLSGTRKEATKAMIDREWDKRNQAAKSCE